MDLYHIRRHSVWASDEELEAATERSKQVGQEMADRIRWIRSYVVREKDGRIGCVCLYQAADPEAVREHGRRIGAPSEDFHVVTATAIVNDDPKTGVAAQKPVGGAPCRPRPPSPRRPDEAPGQLRANFRLAPVRATYSSERPVELRLHS